MSSQPKTAAKDRKCKMSGRLDLIGAGIRDRTEDLLITSECTALDGALSRGESAVSIDAHPVSDRHGPPEQPKTQPKTDGGHMDSESRPDIAESEEMKRLLFEFEDLSGQLQRSWDREREARERVMELRLRVQGLEKACSQLHRRLCSAYNDVVLVLKREQEWQQKWFDEKQRADRAHVPPQEAPSV